MAVQVLLRPVGYWTSRRGDGLPDPRQLMSVKWERDRRSMIAAYLSSAAVLERLDSKQTCSICGADGGRKERTDGVWRWPEMLAHYVAQHGVQLPQEFIAQMEQEDFRPPDVNVKRLRDQLAPENPAATSLMSKAAAAAALDDLLADQRPTSAASAAASTKKKPSVAVIPAHAQGQAQGQAQRQAKAPVDVQRPTGPPGKRADLEDETMAIVTGSAWTAKVRGVPTKPQQITFDRPIVLGRDRTCDVVLEHSSVSRRHARFVPGDDRVIVQDLDSQNGVWLRRKRCSGQIELKDGDEVSLGQATITLQR